MSKTITVFDLGECNKLIAEFMGLEIITDGISWFDTNYKSLGNYDSSWDWLMPVVEKIENLEFGKWYVHIQGNTVNIEDGNDGIGLWDFHINNEDPILSLSPSNKNLKPIEAVYIAVTEFIRWYNEQIKENESSIN